ncbi:cyclophilin-like fold protein [Lachnospiraceae bacterium 46-61]
MKPKMLLAVLSSAMLFSAIPTYAQTPLILQINNKTMTANGIKKEIDSEPVIINNRTLLPIRTIIEEIGGTVNWDNEKQEITLTYQGDSIHLVIGNTTAYLNDTAITLDTAPVIINGRTMLPIRFIAESFHFDVIWDNQTITITKQETAEQQLTIENTNTEQSNNEQGNITALSVRFGADTFTLILENNETASYLAAFAETSEMNLPVYHFDDFDGYEYMQYYQIPSRYEIPTKLTRVTSAKAGEVYYADNKVILFYQDADIDENYIKIGTIEDTTGLQTAVEQNPVVEGWGNKVISISRK